MVGAEAEAVGHAAAHPGQRLKRLRRGANEDRRPELLAAGHRPRHAVLALDRRAAVDADDDLAVHDARPPRWTRTTTAPVTTRGPDRPT